MCYIYYLTTFLRIDFLSFFILFLQVCKLLFINYNIVNFNLFLKFYLTLKNFNLKALPKTDTELNDIAKAAIIGSNFGPLKNA